VVHEGSTPNTSHGQQSSGQDPHVSPAPQKPSPQAKQGLQSTPQVAQFSPPAVSHEPSTAHEQEPQSAEHSMHDSPAARSHVPSTTHVPHGPQSTGQVPQASPKKKKQTPSPHEPGVVAVVVVVDVVVVAMVVATVVELVVVVAKAAHCVAGGAVRATKRPGSSRTTMPPKSAHSA
jgi:hypothetical protein